MNGKLKLIVVTIVILIIGCKSTKEVIYEPTDFKIEFGKSGGFTNVPMDYLINGNGNVYKHVEGDYSYVKTISKKHLKELKQALKMKEFGKVTINEPGNMTYFINVKCPEFENNIQWNDQSKADIANLIYDQLISILKN